MLRQWRNGEMAARDEVLALVYQRLRELARRELRHRPAGNALAPTELIHEAYLRLDQSDNEWDNRAHFFAAAATVMRRILVDAFRARKAAKRGGDALAVTLNTDQLGAEAALDLGELEQALTRLAKLDTRKCHLLELHYFGGLSFEQIAQVEQIARATVGRELKFAKAWLKSELAA